MSEAQDIRRIEYWHNGARDYESHDLGWECTLCGHREGGYRDFDEAEALGAALHKCCVTCLGLIDGDHATLCADCEFNEAHDAAQRLSVGEEGQK